MPHVISFVKYSLKYSLYYFYLIIKALDFRYLKFHFLPQRLMAAFLAIFLRSAFESALARAFPPLLAPSWPKAHAIGFLPGGQVGVVWPCVAC